MTTNQHYFSHYTKKLILNKYVREQIYLLEDIIGIVSNFLNIEKKVLKPIINCINPNHSSFF